MEASLEKMISDEKQILLAKSNELKTIKNLSADEIELTLNSKIRFADAKIINQYNKFWKKF